MTESELNEKLRTLFQNEFPALAGLRADRNIWESGALDSMGLVVLVERIENLFGFRFPPGDLTEQTFASTGSIAGYLTAKLAGDG